MDERVVIHLFQDLPGRIVAMNQASSGINLTWSEEFGFRFSEAQTRQDDRGQEKGETSEGKSKFFMGLRWEEVGCLSKKARLRELWGEFS